MKPGYLTTEFYLTIVIQVLNALVQSGLIGDGTQLVKACSFAAATLTAVAYAISRGMAKAAAAPVAIPGELVKLDTSRPVDTMLERKADEMNGFARVELLAVIGIAMLALGCGWLKSEAKHTASNVVDCTTERATAAIKEFGPTVDSVVVNAIDTAGRADWEQIKSATKDFAVAVGGCVLQSTIVRLLGEAQSAGVLSSPVPIDKASLASGWDQLRREQFGGATFKGAQ